RQIFNSFGGKWSHVGHLIGLLSGFIFWNFFSTQTMIENATRVFKEQSQWSWDNLKFVTPYFTYINYIYLLLSYLIFYQSLKQGSHNSLIVSLKRQYYD